MVESGAETVVTSCQESPLLVQVQMLRGLARRRGGGHDQKDWGWGLCCGFSSARDTREDARLRLPWERAGETRGHVKAETVMNACVVWQRGGLRVLQGHRYA